MSCRGDIDEREMSDIKLQCGNRLPVTLNSNSRAAGIDTVSRISDNGVRHCSSYCLWSSLTRKCNTSCDEPTPTVVLLPAYNETILPSPPLSNPPIHRLFTLNLLADGANVNGLSIPQRGSFYGSSVEMSVINQLREYFYAPLSKITLVLTVWDSGLATTARDMHDRCHAEESYAKSKEAAPGRCTSKSASKLPVRARWSVAMLH